MTVPRYPAMRRQRKRKYAPPCNGLHFLLNFSRHAPITEPKSADITGADAITAGIESLRRYLAGLS